MKKKIHVVCFSHYLDQSKFDFSVQDDTYCCATKASCSKMKVGNQGATTRWDADGPNGPYTLPNSESVVLNWWTTGDNWSFYKGGKNANGKIITTKKENTWKVLSGKI